MKYTIFVLYQALPAWLRLSRAERRAVFAQEVAPLLTSYAGQLEVRFYDSEAFHARVSDVLLVRCDELRPYYFFMERLRDTSLFGAPYIELRDVIIGLEDGFRDFEAYHPASS